MDTMTRTFVKSSKPTHTTNIHAARVRRTELPFLERHLPLFASISASSFASTNKCQITYQFHRNGDSGVWYAAPKGWVKEGDKPRKCRKWSSLAYLEFEANHGFCDYVAGSSMPCPV